MPRTIGIGNQHRRAVVRRRGRPDERDRAVRDITAGGHQPVLDRGTKQGGQRARGRRGVWADRPTTFYYQWADCPDASLNNCTQILGANRSPTRSAERPGERITSSVEAENLAGIGPSYEGSGSLINNSYASDPGPAWARKPASRRS